MDEIAHERPADLQSGRGLRLGLADVVGLKADRHGLVPCVGKVGEALGDVIGTAAWLKIQWGGTAKVAKVANAGTDAGRFR
jgi:hypothetical protein